MSVRWRDEVSGRGVLSRALAVQHRSDRGAVAQSPCRRRTTMQSIPEALRPGCLGYASDSTACGIQKMTLEHWGAFTIPDSFTYPGPPLEFCNYLMLQPGSHYPKVC
jgi:hypothetical protein